LGCVVEPRIGLHLVLFRPCATFKSCLVTQSDLTSGYLCCSDLSLIRRGATRWDNLISTLFAQATSCQLEYKYLAKVTGRAEYYEKVRFPFSFRISSIMNTYIQVERIMDVLYAVNATDGFFLTSGSIMEVHWVVRFSSLF